MSKISKSIEVAEIFIVLTKNLPPTSDFDMSESSDDDEVFEPIDTSKHRKQ